MADKRPNDQEESRPKRVKLSSPANNTDPKDNPYLAHWYEDSTNNKESSNGFSKGNMNGAALNSPLAAFPRHSTTAAMAKRVEDGPNNPFTGTPLSERYFNILKTRRDLPVHAQRYEGVDFYFGYILIVSMQG